MTNNESLRDSEARFRSLCEAAPLGVFLTDLHRQCIFTNQYLQTLGGFSNAEALGEGFARFIHPEDRERIMTERLKPFGAVGVLHYDLRFLRPDQTVCWGSVRTAPVFTSDGQCIGYVGTVEDVTQHKLIEGALKTKETQLAEAQQLAKLGSWQLDGMTGKVLWSDELWRIFGLTPQEFGPSLEEFLAMVHPDDRHLIRSAEEKSRDAAAAFAYDYRIFHSDGSLRFLRGHGKVVRDSDGRVVRIGGADQDITELRRETKGKW